MIQVRNLYRSSNGCAAPTKVHTMACAPVSISSTKRSSKVRAHASSSCACFFKWSRSRRSSPSKVRLNLRVCRRYSAACNFTFLMFLLSGWLAKIASSVCDKTASSTRLTLPMRTTFSPLPSSRSVSRSAAVLLGAVTNTVLSRSHRRAMAATNVVVLPVPGGPCITVTSWLASIAVTAFCCDGLRLAFSSVLLVSNAYLF